MFRLKILIISMLLLSCNNSEKENPLNPKNTNQKDNKLETQDIKNFISKGYEIVNSGNLLNKEYADLNKDGIKDYVLLLASGINNNDYSNSKNIRLSIFEGQNDGSYKMRTQSGNLLSSFLHYNSTKRIKISKKNVITLKHQSMRHDYELKFRYEDNHKNYMLIGAEYNNYGNATGSGAGNISTNYLSGNRFSNINNEKTELIVDRDLIPLSTIDDDNIYKIISQ